MGSPVKSSTRVVARFRMWFDTTPCVRGLTPVTKLTWHGHVVLTKTVAMPSATAPRSARPRRTGVRAAGSFQEKCARPSMLIRMTRGTGP